MKAHFQFESIYESYQDEEMKYMVKGRDFCLDLCGIIDILSKPMEMMNKAQSLEQYLWSVTKWWPKVKAILLSHETRSEQSAI